MITFLIVIIVKSWEKRNNMLLWCELKYKNQQKNSQRVVEKAELASEAQILSWKRELRAIVLGHSHVT